MEIKNTEGLSTSQIRDLVNQGGSFVYYKFCISIIVMTFNRTSDIYFIRPGESKFTPGLGCFFANLILGWWGIPWGPIYTIGNLFNGLTGGTDVTNEIIGDINQRDPNYGTGNNYNFGGGNQTTNQPLPTYNLDGNGNITDNNDSQQNTYNIPK
jgi:hypothetical protein